MFVIPSRAVSAVLGNLKGVSSEMGCELDRQNKQLERINCKGDVNYDHLDETTRRIKNHM